MRGEIWFVDLAPIRGHEQGGTRPCLIISADLFNHGPADLVIVVPITSRDKGIRSHVRIDPPEGGLRTPSFVKAEDIRSVSKARLLHRSGLVLPFTLNTVLEQLRILLDL
jgi:mRNA interferase MazF